jgi:hypothetical protein
MPSEQPQRTATANLNLQPMGFPKALDWSPAKQQESLEQLYFFVMEECAASINWYYRKKGSKSLLGFLLRLGAILAVAVAGLIPLIGELLKRNGIPGISPAWATVALALAGLLIAIDRFGGYTSGWIRYIRTAQMLTSLQGEFRLDWEEYRRSSLEETSGADRTKEGINLCLTFLRAVCAQVRLETDLWAQDFQQALQTVNRNADAQSRSENGG